MRFCFIVTMILFALTLTAGGFASPAQAANPFGVPGLPDAGNAASPGENAGRRPAPASQRPGAQPRRTRPAQQGYYGRFQQWVIDKQRELHRELTKGVRQLKTGNPWLAIWSLALVSFIYGVVHAVGPGHGKAVITSYVFANEKTLKRGIWLAVLSSLMQAITAVTAVTILAILLNATGLRIQTYARYLETASYALVAAIGLWLVVSQLRKIWKHFRSPPGVAAHSHAHDHAHHDHDHDHDHSHSHDDDHHHHHDDPDHVHDEHCGCGHNHIPAAEELTDDDWSWQKALSIILAVGMRPCTGAIIVLVFAFVNGLYWAGVASTFAMAVGTAITISTLAVLAVGSKQLALKLYGEQSRSAALLVNTIALLGGLFVLFLGVTLFMGSMGPARPFG